MTRPPARKTALETLQAQLIEAQALASFGTWEWDVKHDRLVWSEALCQLLGVEHASFRPTVGAFLGFVHAEDRERVSAAAAASRAAGTPYNAPFRVVSATGAVRTVRGASHADRDAAGRPVRIVGLIQDISDQAEAEERLRDYAERVVFLTRRLVDAQEAERRHLANELHDRLGPSLTALSINLQLLHDALPADSRPRAAEAIADSREQVALASATMRDVMGQLRPHDLDVHGLAPALRMMAAGFERRTGIRTAVVASGPERAVAALDLPLFRIAQEALTNIAKHARCDKAWIRYADGWGGVTLEIEDNGAGFPGGVPPVTAGWGLLSMRERAGAVGASCEIVAGASGGVLVRVSAPPV